MASSTARTQLQKNTLNPCCDVAKWHKLIQNHQQSWKCIIAESSAYHFFCDLAFCSQTIHRQYSRHAAVGQAIPRPVQSRCCPRKAPLQRLVCCPTPVRMHTPLRQICDSHLDEGLNSAAMTQVWNTPHWCGKTISLVWLQCCDLCKAC